ncbi:glycoside hydrolase family 10 protein [Argonema galeatum]|uniref:glycoside hydrolase family 10 protein n=1 Tax=Argonema galeatum TaxID=2942762 RepID=UPI002011921D|nr:family 10 glycosylhydrolase [Argonema galeatum A003/A1]
MRSQKSQVTIDKSKSKKQKTKLEYLFPLFLLPFYLVPWLYLGMRIPFSAAAAQGIRLGVVRSPDNATQWSGITTRLSESGVSYCVVDLEKIKNVADLNGVSVLFLPNVESLTQEQTLALEAWMSKGGRAIASGPVGNLSPPGVRQMLRSLLGAYWAFPLSEPEALQPLRTRTQEWVRQELTGTIHGGVIIPTSLNSQTAATWTISDSPPAVVTTNRATFLGWRWGVNTAASAQLDLGWLKAALSRYGNIAQAGVSPPPTSANCVAPGALPNVAAAPRPTPTTAVRGSGGAGVQRGRGAEGQRGRGAEGQRGRGAEGQRGRGAESSPSSLAPSPYSLAPSPVDPTERVATAGIRVAPNGEPIAPQEAIAMRQELQNLLGRVESAILAVNSASLNPGVQVAGGAAEQGKKETIPISSSSTVASTSPISTQNTALGTLQNARDVLQSLPQLIAKRDYATARSQWLQARSNLWNLYPTSSPIVQSEIRAIWLDRGSIVQAGSERGLAKIFDGLAQAGINTVFFETVNAGYTIYPSQVAPEQNPLTKGWDPLAAAVKLAHERGMELHAWVWTFAVGNQRHNAILNQPADYPGPIISAHPDWANYDNQGRMIPAGQTKPFLDPANPEVRRYLLSLCDEILSRYNVDGLHLDYIRYPFQDPSRGSVYGYGKAARQLFQEMAGVDPMKISPSNRPMWQKWTEFRTSQINSFVAEVSHMARQRRPNLIMSAAVFGYPVQERIQKLQQNWEVWAKRGDVDLVMPMAYAQDTNRFSQLAAPWLSNPDLSSTLVLPGILLLNLPEISAIDQIQFVRDLPNGGYSLFAFEHFSDRLRSIFNRTQGNNGATSKEPIPYRQPFAASASIFASLQREWGFLLQTNQLQMAEGMRSPFSTQGSALSTALNQLAQQPNPTNFAAAKNSLKSFRSQFRNWMSQHSTQNSYQVQTWDNRLANLEKLLNYGERVLLNRPNSSATKR